MRIFPICKTGVSIAFIFLLANCSVWQSAVKSTFPYTATVTIPKGAADHAIQSTSADASSFDQRFNKNGNNADKIKDVRVVSAKLVSDDPSDFNLGNLATVKVYLANAVGDEAMVASRTDIGAQVGNSLVLDIEDAKTLDEFVKDPRVKMRIEYSLRDHIYVNAHLKVVLGLRANP